MEKKSISKPSLKLAQRSTTNLEETVKGVETVPEALCSKDAGVETHNSETDNLDGKKADGCDSLCDVKRFHEDDITDIFAPDSREVAVVVSWNWDSSQRNSSPKPEKTKSTTPQGQKKRTTKLCSPLLRGQPPARRKRLLKKDLTNSNSSFVSELRALSEKLQKAKDSVQLSEDTENELCFEISSSSTENINFVQNHGTFSLENLEEIKNDSFKTLLEDVDDDCLIQCSQEVEKNLQEFTSPLKKSPKLQNLGVVKFDKSSPNRTKTPSKGRALNNNLRRSPRIMNQNPSAACSGKFRSNTSTAKKGDNDKVLDEDLVESLLDDEIELLSQIPSPSAILSAEKYKLYPALRNKTQQIPTKNSSEGNLNGIVNLFVNHSSATSVPTTFKIIKQLPEKTQHIVRSGHPVVGVVKPVMSFTSDDVIENKNCIMPENSAIVNEQVNKNNSKRKESLAGTEDRVKSFDDSFCDPALCNLLDSVESSVLSSSPAVSSSPVKNAANNSVQSQVPSSPPLRCTPEEIEKKKREALERRRRRNNSCNSSSSNLKSMHHSVQHGSRQEERLKVQPLVPSSPPKRYTPEEIEKKRLEALQIKRQQSLIRTTTYSRQRLHKK
ncbi:uncharacterized protein LOC134530607 isoform X2 [Bacillus rossius redtenbacheri]|uniref:uncharacterized protein LOC134530607 isoform X2 n=1 Tax=Bacillus rossius redtenbacheri TaxID=93214 RepID=UPI002FDE3E86